MKNETRVVFNAYAAAIAQLNGVPDATEKFVVAPSVAQTLLDRVQENADFLREINNPMVPEQSAEILGLGTNSPAAGRTDTTAADRQPRSITNLDGRTYACVQTNYDTYVTYKQLDMWAKFPDFQQRMRNHVTLQVARDRLMVGFNGTSIAANTDIAVNPLLQDVNKGWLQKIREHAAGARVLSNIKVGAEAGADYRNVDALFYDVLNELIDPWYRNDTAIVAITGDQLVTDKYLAILNSASVDAPTEKAAMQTLISNRTIGSRPSKQVPFFPSKKMLVTKASNLSLYTQDGTVRRQVQDQPQRDRVVDFLSMNEDYVIEDMGACALVDSILTWNGSAWA
ncbi:MAG: phage major capsid protein, P2 family [Alphaproteobacteria bacterium]|nr:phage major capsid protein, P2 family [Alphaproteobacteria bacterium]